MHPAAHRKARPHPFLHSLPDDTSARELLLKSTVPKLVGYSICEIERELILDTLLSYSGSRTQSAKVLGISIRTLRNKIHECELLGMTVPTPVRDYEVV